MFFSSKWRVPGAFTFERLHSFQSILIQLLTHIKALAEGGEQGKKKMLECINCLLISAMHRLVIN